MKSEMYAALSVTFAYFLLESTKKKNNSRCAASDDAETGSACISNEVTSTSIVVD